MKHPDQTLVPNEVNLLTNSGSQIESGSPDDIYLLLQGSAHITPFTGDNIEVVFLDEAGNRKQPIPFILEADPTIGGFKTLKIMNLQLIIECSREEMQKLNLSNYFPKVVNEIIRTSDNTRQMNPPPPPFNKPKP